MYPYIPFIFTYIKKKENKREKQKQRKERREEEKRRGRGLKSWRLLFKVEINFQGGG